MASDEYDKVEQPALDQLQSLGWNYIDGSQLSPEESDERTSFKEVVLESRLRQSIQRINTWINDENLRKVTRDLIQIQTPTLLEANQSIWETLTNYISVQDEEVRPSRSLTSIIQRTTSSSA